jgi:predicted transcriptional regulator of viral defense system
LKSSANKLLRGRLRTITDDYELLVEKENQILAFLETHVSIDRKTAIELIGLQKTKAAEILKRLTEKGQLTKIGKGRSTIYVRNKG